MGGIARAYGQSDAQGIALQIRFFNMVALGKLLCLLRQLARGEAITQDVSTLENPAILEQLKG